MAWELDIPGFGALSLEHLVLDLNGTLATDGHPAPGVVDALAGLGEELKLHLITADTFGTAAGLFPSADIELEIIRPGGEGAQKLALVERLGTERCAALGNGANDVEMLKAAALGICVMGAEGCDTQALAAAQVVVAAPRDGLELFLRPARLKATLRR